MGYGAVVRLRAPILARVVEPHRLWLATVPLHRGRYHTDSLPQKHAMLERYADPAHATRWCRVVRLGNTEAEHSLYNRFAAMQLPLGKFRLE